MCGNKLFQLGMTIHFLHCTFVPVRLFLNNGVRKILLAMVMSIRTTMTKKSQHEALMFKLMHEDLGSNCYMECIIVSCNVLCKLSFIKPSLILFVQELSLCLSFCLLFQAHFLRANETHSL